MIQTLHLGLSYKCNFSCPHCYVNKSEDALTTAHYKKFISLLDKQGLLLVLYTFGESLLSDKLFEIARFTHSLGISQTILTNWWLLNKTNLEMLSMCGVNNYNVSLDSTFPNKHDNNRGCVGAYSHAINAIRLLKKAEKQVGIGVTVTNDNADELKQFIELAESEHVDRISFLAQRSDGALAGPMSSQYLTIFKDAILERLPVKNIFFHDQRLLSYIQELYSSSAISSETFYRWNQMNSCHINYSVSLAPNGNVTSCNLCGNQIICNISNSIEFDDSLLKRIEDTHERFICCPMLSKANYRISNSPLD